MAVLRANMDDDERAVVREQNRIAMRINREINRTKVSRKDGLRSQDILNGNFNVLRLEDTLDSIGSMRVKCDKCGALKFKAESKAFCCGEGKYLPEVFPRPPEPIMKLWMGTDSKAKLFRKFPREMNNAVALASIQVKEKRFAGFSPNVIFQGKAFHRTGALIPEDGERPVYAQLYVVDSALENTQRFANMTLPRGISMQQKTNLKSILNTVQETIHQVNPFVADFKQIMDLEDLADGKIVITAKAPNNEHARRYNLQVNLREVSILTNEEKHDLVIHKRGGQLQTISSLNPKGMCLREADKK